MFGWLFWLSPTPSTEPTMQEEPTEEATAVPEPEVEADRAAPPVPLQDSLLTAAQHGDSREIVVETPLYRATLSTRGATITSFILKKYKKFDQETPVQLVDSSRGGAIALNFTTPSSHLVDTRSLYFTSDAPDGVIQVQDEPVSVTFRAPMGSGSLTQTYVFQPKEYEVELHVGQENPSSYLTSEGYELVWNGGVPFTENDPQTEGRATGAFARSGGEIESITLDKDVHQEQRLAGTVDWAAVKNKYFTAVMIPSAEARGASLIGDKDGVVEDYTARLMMPAAPAEGHDFRLYLGPMEFYRITDYDLGLYGMVDYGWDFFEFITRPLAQFVFIPVFTFLSKFIPSYGIVIIIFGFLVKLLVYPLTKSSYTSMARMREMQPKMEAIKEKFADNPQKQQEAMMKMYKETGVNPLGGVPPDAPPVPDHHCAVAVLSVLARAAAAEFPVGT